MKEADIVDARNGDYVLIKGEIAQGLIRNRVGLLRDSYKSLLARMDNELTDKKSAVTLMIAMELNDTTCNEQVLFFRGCVERAAWLDKEILELTAISSTFRKEASYRITVADALRFGLGL